VSDWLADTADVRLDRGMPGDGQIDNRSIRSWVEAAGYRGPVEVEIFSARNWWRQSPDTVVETICERLSFL
jgi:sugar phosphate isomerase/epimerase